MLTSLFKESSYTEIPEPSRNSNHLFMKIGARYLMRVGLWTAYGAVVCYGGMKILHGNLRPGYSKSSVEESTFVGSAIFSLLLALPSLMLDSAVKRNTDANSTKRIFFITILQMTYFSSSSIAGAAIGSMLMKPNASMSTVLKASSIGNAVGVAIYALLAVIHKKFANRGPVIEDNRSRLVP